MPRAQGAGLLANRPVGPAPPSPPSSRPNLPGLSPTPLLATLPFPCTHQFHREGLVLVLFCFYLLLKYPGKCQPRSFQKEETRWEQRKNVTGLGKMNKWYHLFLLLCLTSGAPSFHSCRAGRELATDLPPATHSPARRDPKGPLPPGLNTGSRCTNSILEGTIRL